MPRSQKVTEEAFKMQWHPGESFRYDREYKKSLSSSEYLERLVPSVILANLSLQLSYLRGLGPLTVCVVMALWPHQNVNKSLGTTENLKKALNPNEKLENALGAFETV